MDIDINLAVGILGNLKTCRKCKLKCLEKFRNWWDLHGFCDKKTKIYSWTISFLNDS